MKYIIFNMKAYYRYGDLFPDNYPSKDLVDENEKKRMIEIREAMLNGTKQLREKLSHIDGEYCIENDLKGPCYVSRISFRKQLAKCKLLFSSYKDCQTVIDEMLKIKRELE